MRRQDLFIGAVAAIGIALSMLTGAKAAPLMIASPVVGNAAVNGDMFVAVQNRPGFEKRGSQYWYNGHRGSPKPRPGWKRHRGWWFPPAAFAIQVGPSGPSVVVRPGATPAPRGILPARHIRWCQQKYRSYRPGDNSFQPYNGPRRKCRSPYWQ